MFIWALISSSTSSRSIEIKTNFVGMIVTTGRRRTIKRRRRGRRGGRGR
jgi:hypothetical protein